MKKLVLILGCTMIAANLNAAEVWLAWDPPVNSNWVSGYKMYYGWTSRSYTNPIDVGMVETGRIAGLDHTLTHYFAMTAYATNWPGTGYLESGFSRELVWDNDKPTIAWPAGWALVIQVPAGATESVAPDITGVPTITDNFSTGTNLVVRQMPAPGVKVDLHTPHIRLTAADEAGNVVTNLVALTWIVIYHPEPGTNVTGRASNGKVLIGH